MWPQNVRKTDLRIDFYRGSGPGGQNKNKRDTACRMTHIPTGIVAAAEDERTQAANKRLAFKRLAAKLAPLMKKAAKSKESEVITERIRTYNKIRNEVIDHRTGKKYNYDEFLNGGIA